MPTLVPALMSASLAGMTARTVAPSLSLSLSAAPSRDLTTTMSPSTPSTVPRTRTGGDCWAKLADPASIKANPEVPNVRRDILFIVILPKIADEELPAIGVQPSHRAPGSVGGCGHPRLFGVI